MTEKIKLSEAYLDATFGKFELLAKSLVEEDKIHNPVAFVAFTSDEPGKVGTAYASFEGVGAREVEAIGGALRVLGKKLHDEKLEPVQVFFALTGAMRRLSKDSSSEDRQDAIDFLKRSIEEGGQPDEDEEKTLLVMMLSHDGRRRTYVAKYENPPDGGAVFYEEYRSTVFKQYIGFTDVDDLLSGVFDD